MTEKRQAAHQWLRLSLRTLLLLTAAIAFWLGLIVDRAKKQQAAVDAIREAGGEIGYDFQTGIAKDGTHFIDPNGTSRTPSWLRDTFGDDYFHQVRSVQLTRAGKTDGPWMKHLEQLPHLRALLLRSREVTDTELECISSLSELRFLGLYEATLEGDGLRHVAELRELRQLLLDGSTATDAMLVQLKGLPHLLMSS